VESLNGTLRDELLNGEIFYTVAEVRVLIERWREHYNRGRPHSALGYRPPAPEATSGSDGYRKDMDSTAGPGPSGGAVKLI
jgi:putative transposase